MELWPERLCDEEDAIRVGGLEVLANTPDEVRRVDQIAHIQHNQTTQPEGDEHGNVQRLSEVLEGGVKRYHHVQYDVQQHVVAAEMER